MNAGDMSMLTELTCSGAQPRSFAGQRLDGLDAAPLGHRQHPTLGRVGGQGDVVMSARPRRLVDGELEQQGKVRQIARPRRLDLPHRAVRQPHPRHAHLQEALVLEEVQMPIAIGHRVVDRMLVGHVRHREATAWRKIHSNRQRARLRVEIRPGHVPRRTDPQNGRNSLSVIPGAPHYDRDRESTHSDFNRGKIERVCRDALSPHLPGRVNS